MKSIRPLLSLLVMAGLALGAPVLRAQEPAHPAQAAGTEPSPAPQAGAEHGQAPEAEHGQAPEAEHGQAPEAGHGQAAEEHEAHHARITLFGHDLGKGAQFGIQAFNFALFAGLLFFLLKGALASAFKARARELEDKLSQAERERAQADAQIQELETRMAGLQGELAGILARAEAEAETEKERIVEAAKAEAAQILAQTHADIENQKRAAESELRSLVAELALEGATKRLQNQVTGEVATRVMDRSIQQVGGAQ